MPTLYLLRQIYFSVLGCDKLLLSYCIIGEKINPNTFGIDLNEYKIYKISTSKVQQEWKKKQIYTYVAYNMRKEMGDMTAMIWFISSLNVTCNKIISRYSYLWSLSTGNAYFITHLQQQRHLDTRIQEIFFT